MVWTCPACRLAIQHSDHEPTPRAGVVYRCHVCRLELVADVRTGEIVLTPFRVERDLSIDSPGEASTSAPTEPRTVERKRSTRSRA